MEDWNIKRVCLLCRRSMLYHTQKDAKLQGTSRQEIRAFNTSDFTDITVHQL
jgi:hypothetical protein